MGDEVCGSESYTWFQCVEKHLLDREGANKCLPPREAFDSCVRAWRTVVGPNVKLKGENQGEPPIQCAAMGCLIEACLKKTMYDSDRCRPITAGFKHCVKGLYGSEFVD